MPITIDGQTFEDFDAAVEHVRRTKKIKSPEGYVATIERKQKAAKVKSDIAKMRIAITRKTTSERMLDRAKRVSKPYFENPNFITDASDEEHKQNRRYVNTGTKIRPPKPTQSERVKAIGAKIECPFKQLQAKIDEQKIALEHQHQIIFRYAKGESYQISNLQQQGKFWKYWLLNAKQTNGNGWGVSEKTIRQNIARFKGKPFVITAKQWIENSEYGDQFEHPYVPTNHLPTIFQHQAKFTIGVIDDVFEDKNGDFYATIRPLPKFAMRTPPPFCSPAIFQLDPREPENAISKWEALHLAGLDRDPAYGAAIAMLKGTCIGTPQECSVQFKGAKQLSAWEVGCAECKKFKEDDKRIGLGTDEARKHYSNYSEHIEKYHENRQTGITKLYPLNRGNKGNLGAKQQDARSALEIFKQHKLGPEHEEGFTFDPSRNEFLTPESARKYYGKPGTSMHFISRTKNIRSPDDLKLEPGEFIGGFKGQEGFEFDATKILHSNDPDEVQKHLNLGEPQESAFSIDPEGKVSFTKNKSYVKKAEQEKQKLEPIEHDEPDEDAIREMEEERRRERLRRDIDRHVLRSGKAEITKEIIKSKLALLQKFGVRYNSSFGPDLDALDAFKNKQKYQSFAGRGKDKKIKFESTGKELKLHGHVIARHNKKGIEVSNAGHDTGLTYSSIKGLGINARIDPTDKNYVILHNKKVHVSSGEFVLVPHSEISKSSIKYTNTQYNKNIKATVSDQSYFNKGVARKQSEEQGREGLPLSSTSIQPKDQKIINRITGIKTPIGKEILGTKAHHIFPKSAYPELRRNLNNGIMLTTAEHEELHKLNPAIVRRRIIKAKLDAQIRLAKIQGLVETDQPEKHTLIDESGRIWHKPGSDHFDLTREHLQKRGDVSDEDIHKMLKDTKTIRMQNFATDRNPHLSFHLANPATPAQLKTIKRVSESNPDLQIGYFMGHSTDSADYGQARSFNEFRIKHNQAFTKPRAAQMEDTNENMTYTKSKKVRKLKELFPENTNRSFK